jgi:hypothetical protein
VDDDGDLSEKEDLKNPGDSDLDAERATGFDLSD